MLYCPNYTCQTPNPESYKFCQKCRTLLPHHYLWAVGESAGHYQSGDIVGDRYLCKSSRVFLDAKPGLYSTAPTEIPADLVAYPRLSPYQVHVPQIYDIVSLSNASKLLLLDQGALDSTSVVLEGASPAGSDAAEPHLQPQLLPALIDEWSSAIALRQLNWLWQMAHLWYPLASQKVASTLLAPELLRVEGGLLRLLELRSDGSDVPTLVQLGQLWAIWAKQARPEIAKGLMQVSQQLTQGQIRNAEQLMGQLDSLLVQVGRSLSYQIHLATQTDQGPSRQRNEDACYPPGGSVTSTVTQSPNPSPVLVIVCDGIGGHQGGDVASNLAIESLRQQIQALSLDTLDATSLTLALERAVCVANDLISQRNDSEQRLDRQRMGTTLVMGLVRGHELYITHVGDSRAYRVSLQGCHQVTQDDDVASREVRLGYSSYREALQQPSAGSLVQALGMGSSAILHPTVQRFILDEDSVFLLCSDGLSDNDRVEEVWDALLLPLLKGSTTVGAVSQQLVGLANTRNGHDNVTVGLLHIQVAGQTGKPGVTATVQAIAPPTPSSATVLQDKAGKTVQLTQANPQSRVTASAGEPLPTAPPATGDPAIAKTQVLPTPPSKAFKPLPLLLGILLLLSGGGLLAYSLSLSFRGWVDTLLGSARVPSPSPTPLASPTPVAVATPIPIGAFLQVNPPSPSSTISPSGMVVLSQPRDLQPPVVDASLVPPGSVVQVVRGQATTPQERWVEVRVCSIPTEAIPIDPPLSDTPSGAPLPNSPAGASLNAFPATPNRPPTSAGEGFEPSPNTPTSPLPATPLPASPLPATPLSSPSPLSPSVDPSAVPLPQPLEPGRSGWIQEPAVVEMVSLKLDLTPQEQGVCQGTSAPVTAAPKVSHVPTDVWHVGSSLIKGD